MNKQEYLLVCLIEECSEIQKEVSKALRFGLGDFNPTEPGLDNYERITNEFCDLLGVLRMLDSEYDINFPLDNQKIKEKMNKLKKYMKYAKDKGTLT